MKGSCRKEASIQVSKLGLRIYTYSHSLTGSKSILHHPYMIILPLEKARNISSLLKKVPNENECHLSPMVLGQVLAFNVYLQHSFKACELTRGGKTVDDCTNGPRNLFRFPERIKE